MPAATRASSSSARPGAQPEMPQDERSRRGCAPPARRSSNSSAPRCRRRRQSAASGRASGCAWPAAAAAARCRSRSAAAAAGGFLRRRPRAIRSEQESQTAGLSQHRPERALSLGLRQDLRRLLLPITSPTYSGHLAQEPTQCQSSCAAPAELYVYRNPGQDMEQAISLNGVPYQDLPDAFKYKTTYVKGCSCKQGEYNPTEIEAANQKAEGDAGRQESRRRRALQRRRPRRLRRSGPSRAQQLDINVTGATRVPKPRPRHPRTPPRRRSRRPRTCRAAAAPPPSQLMPRLVGGRPAQQSSHRQEPAGDKAGPQ